MKQGNKYLSHKLTHLNYLFDQSQQKSRQLKASPPKIQLYLCLVKKILTETSSPLLNTQGKGKGTWVDKIEEGSGIRALVKLKLKQNSKTIRIFCIYSYTTDKRLIIPKLLMASLGSQVSPKLLGPPLNLGRPLIPKPVVPP